MRVTGTLDDDGSGLLVVRPAGEADVVKLVGVLPVGATEVDTGDVSEDTEGLVIVVEGTVTRGPTNDLPFGYSVFVDDGTGGSSLPRPASTPSASRSSSPAAASAPAASAASSAPRA